MTRKTAEREGGKVVKVHTPGRSWWWERSHCVGDKGVKERSSTRALRWFKSPRIQGGNVSHVTDLQDWLTGEHS